MRTSWVSTDVELIDDRFPKDTSHVWALGENLFQNKMSRLSLQGFAQQVSGAALALIDLPGKILSLLVEMRYPRTILHSKITSLLCTTSCTNRRQHRFDVNVLFKN